MSEEAIAAARDLVAQDMSVSAVPDRLACHALDLIGSFNRAG